MKISVVIPTIEMNGTGREFLGRNLDVLSDQTYKNFEVVITDNSETDAIKKLCETYNFLPIRYFRNPNKGAAKNTNEGIKRANGELIKIIHQDDFLSHNDSLKNIVQNFKNGWMVSWCNHFDGENFINEHHGFYNKQIHLGLNTIGAPSVLTIRRHKNQILFDENLVWLFDCDYYRKMYDRYGPPTILEEINVTIGLGKHQATHHISNERKNEEERILIERYE